MKNGAPTLHCVPVTAASLDADIRVPHAVFLTYGDDFSDVIRVVHGNARHVGRNLFERCLVCVLDELLQSGHDRVELFDGGFPLGGIELEGVVVVGRFLWMLALEAGKVDGIPEHQVRQ